MIPEVKSILDELRAYKRSRALAVAIELGMLKALRNRAAPTEQVAIASGVALDWTCNLLSALKHLGLVSYSNGCWSLTTAGIAAHDDPAVRAFAGYHSHCYESWLDLPKRCRPSANGPGFHRQRILVPEFAEAYVQAMEAIAVLNLPFLLERCCLSGSIIDIGAGPSTYCRRLATTGVCQVTGIDFLPIVDAAKRLFRYPVDFTWTASDFQDYIAPKPFDAAFCGHLLEYCSADDLPGWLHKLRTLLRPEATAAFVLFLRAPDQMGIAALDLFELSTGVNGDRLGHICTRDEFRDRLEEAGATGIECQTLPAGPSYAEYLVTCKWS